MTLVLGVAACGGGSSKSASGVASLSGASKASSSNSGQSQPLTAAQFRAQSLAYAQCMRDNGVAAYPDPQFDANGQPVRNQGNGSFDTLRNSPAFDKARTACQSKRPRFAGQFTPTQLADLRTSLLKYAACMRTKGVNFPDPTFDANGRPQFTRDRAAGAAPGSTADQNRNDPTFQAAATACRATVGRTLPRGFGGGGPGRPSTGAGA